MQAARAKQLLKNGIYRAIGETVAGTGALDGEGARTLRAPGGDHGGSARLGLPRDDEQHQAAWLDTSEDVLVVPRTDRLARYRHSRSWSAW